jgi:hypothetical protein
VTLVDLVLWDGEPWTVLEIALLLHISISRSSMRAKLTFVYTVCMLWLFVLVITIFLLLELKASKQFIWIYLLAGRTSCVVTLWYRHPVIPSPVFESSNLVHFFITLPYLRTFLLWPFKAAFRNSTFCPHSVFICFVWIWEQTTFISLYGINWLVFITETESLLRGTNWVLNNCNSGFYFKGFGWYLLLSLIVPLLDRNMIWGETER